MKFNWLTSLVAFAAGALLQTAGATSCTPQDDDARIEVAVPSTPDATNTDVAAAPPPFSPTFELAALFPDDSMKDPSKVQVTLKGVNIKTLPSGVVQAGFAFRSQVWQASGWDHSAYAYFPSEEAASAAPPGREGLWVLIHGAAPGLDSQVSADTEFGLSLVQRLGVPVVSIGDLPATTVFHSEGWQDLADEHPDCFDRKLSGSPLANCALDLTRAAEDLGFDLLVPLTRAYLRAMTAMPLVHELALSEEPNLAHIAAPTRFLLLGAGGQRATAAWIASHLDNRVVGAFVSAPEPASLESFWSTVALDWPEQGGDAANWLSFLQSPFGRSWRTLHDATAWGEKSTHNAAVFIARGSNDPLVPLAPTAAFGASALGAPPVAWAPNFGHGFTHALLAGAWRRFAETVANGATPPPRPTVLVQSAGNDWSVTLDLEGAAPDATCDWWYTSRPTGASERDYRNAVWAASSFQPALGSIRTARVPTGSGTSAGFAWCCWTPEGATHKFCDGSALWASWFPASP